MAQQSPTTEEMQKRLKKIPEGLRNIMSSNEVEDNLEKISQKYNLGDKAHLLSLYTAHVFLGFLEPKSFKGTLQENLKLDPEDALHLSEEVDKKVFFRARVYLQKMHPPSAFKPHVEDHEPLVSAQPAEMEGAIIPEPEQARYGTSPEKPIFSPPTEPVEENVVDLREKKEDQYLEAVEDEEISEEKPEEREKPKHLEEGNVVDLSKNAD